MLLVALRWLVVLLAAKGEELGVLGLTSSKLIANVSHGEGLIALFHWRNVQMVAFGDEWICRLGQKGLVIVLLVKRATKLGSLNHRGVVQVFVEKVLGGNFRHLSLLFLFWDVGAVVINVDRRRTNVSQILDGLLNWVAIAISRLVL